MPVSASTSYRDRLNEKLFQQRTLLLTGEVDDEMAERVCAEMVLLASADPERDIILYINSPGGSVLAGLAIYDTMKLVPNDVVTVALGMAASMGQVLLASGTHGKRISLAHSRIMMHQPSAGIGGTAIDIAIQSENLRYMKRQSEEILAAETGRSVEEIAADSDRDRWFTPEQARDYGMIDEIVGSFHILAPYAAPNRTGFSS
ncbi:ATP-dependent Clp protease proteolytic subunit [Microbispora triticiradicis]|uniref:ATP-dependent Clp protease proteolytic subunit n=3 Tax=Microbispora TaxID=2005 RepID=A0ABY3M5E0_9ACTN|nr:MULTISPECIES: ATP-dependent Clp protease proteolytic subunit [Microbispora]RGA04639.1 ATP-dependent Clp protease proteolytic subunit [Microbispora triticiradicis]TLP66618.1 ATP-dependent Clp protease proteolytic subunit [Microbispora fusca]TYB67566.1 ATP-dependent Clp protease proteolytic subunit [Microbispora tritici]GLW25530.1 ATP-dependent Clp protease proteolytic subunit 3 [Microbispora amethystogenes]